METTNAVTTSRKPFDRQKIENALIATVIITIFIGALGCHFRWW